MGRNQADNARLDRLVGDGNSEAGIDLASLFRVILNQIQDSGDGIETAALTAPAQEAVSNHARVEHWYGEDKRGPWAALIGDALEQLQRRKLIEQTDGDLWHPKFTPGKKLAIIPARKGRHGTVGLTLYSAAEREARGLAEKRRMEITSLAASLREDGPGLRPLAPEHVEALERSMRDYGYRKERPILVDQHGRILDGRHRIAAARRAGVTPEEKRVTVASDEEAVGFALLVNIERGWTKDERKRIDRVLQSAGLTVDNIGQQIGGRERIRAELLEQAALEKPLTHRAIAKRLGVPPGSDRLVGEECRNLIHTAMHYNECPHRFTEDGKEAPGPKPKGAPKPKPTLGEPEIAVAMDGISQGQNKTEVGRRLGLEHDSIPLAAVYAKAEERLKPKPEPHPEPEPAPPAAEREAEPPSWELMAKLFGRLPDDDKAAFLKAIGAYSEPNA